MLFCLAGAARAFYAMRGIADVVGEVLITLSIVMDGYALAQTLHVSWPVAIAVAGLIMGNQGDRYAMSDHAK